MPSRRDVLRGLAGLGAAAALGTTPATASHPEAQPEHVTLSYDQTALERYRPRLDLRGVDPDPTLWGWWAESPEYETDVAVFWAEYPFQEGVTQYDSHRGDHEPVYVVVDDTTGDVEAVWYSAYHWLRGVTTAPPLFEDTHPELDVIDPWHHYTPTAGAGELLPVEDLGLVFEDWLANGLEVDLREGAVVEPWTMATAESWWRPGTLGLGTETFVELRRLLGVHDADGPLDMLPF